ncbi:hypothetical protein [Hyphomicrobium sp.]|uniref:hypothetical protein n=1 Tax=Hyphomicrobium sp. TaxID=82 RepID=UPI0025C4267D|nr:hypothetical protein [Hyphomicrobium sp.]MCC7252504.1 sensor histidine kinase [Hyphomicrobium sp.]
MSLALNELITNSIKYGALSNSHGTVSVQWDPAGFHFAWQEVGIESHGRTTREGFGTKVLMQFVPASFNGKASMHFPGDRLLYELVAPPAAIRATS